MKWDIVCETKVLGRVPRDEIAQVIEMLDGVSFWMSGVLVEMVLGGI
jgi:hypothetical protein